MPVQILPSIPSFGSRLTEALGGALSNVAEGIQKRNQSSKLQALIKQFSPTQNPNADPSQQNGENLVNKTPLEFADLANQAEKVLGKEGSRVLVDQFSKQRDSALKEGREIRKEDREAARKEQEKIDTTQKEVLSGYEGALVSEANLNRMEALIDKDEMVSPLGDYLSGLFRVPVSLWSTADTEEFQKLASQRALKVGSAYGFGRILDKEFESFLQTIPSLLNSKEGKQRIIGTLRYFDNLAKARYKTFTELSKEHPGKERAAQLDQKLAERMKPLYDKFGEVLTYGDELVQMISPEGKKGKVPKNQVQEALSENYQLVQ